MKEEESNSSNELFTKHGEETPPYNNDTTKEDVKRLEQIRLQKEEREKKLQELIAAYDYSAASEYISTSFIMFSSLVQSVIGAFSQSNNLQLAELISLLDSCRGNKITISGIVSHPKKGELKSQLKKIELSSSSDLHHLNLWANTMLERSQDGFYQYEFNWDFKDNVKHYNSIDNSVSFDDFYTEPYTEEELEKILTYERDIKKKEKNFTRNAEYGRCLAAFYNFLESNGIFTAHSNKGKAGKATGITKEYCFMYDCLVLLNATEPLDDNKEKYTNVKDWINAFAAQAKK